MAERCLAVLCAKLTELRRLLDQADVPVETAQAIRAELERMEQIISDMTRDRD